MTRRRPHGRVARVAAIVAAVLVCTAGPRAQEPRQFPVTGIVLDVRPAQGSFVVSHDAIPGLMAAMTMPFDVKDVRELDGLTPGMTVTFSLVLGADAALAERIRVVRYESVEQDPLIARRLKLLRDLNNSTRVEPLPVGQLVPDFSLIDQVRNRVSLSQFRGKVVAVNFIYTSCALPQFCFRIANHFGVIQNRFQAQVGRDLVLLTITFDPARDTPEVLAEYASQWKADPNIWHFLTGEANAVHQVCDVFGVDFFADEGLMNHSARTAVIDRQGRLVANIEGNRYTAAQLGDLIATTLSR